MDNCIIPVVKEEFLPGLYRALGKDADPVVSVYHHYLRVAVWIDGMICKANLVSLSCRIDNEICEQGQHFTLHRLNIQTETRECECCTCMYCVDGTNCKINTNSASPGSILSTQLLCVKPYLLTFPPLSVARYSFIQLNELGHLGENENAQTFKR